MVLRRRCDGAYAVGSSQTLAVTPRSRAARAPDWPSSAQVLPSRLSSGARWGASTASRRTDAALARPPTARAQQSAMPVIGLLSRASPPPVRALRARDPARLPQTDLAQLTDEVIGALKTVYDPEIP